MDEGHLEFDLWRLTPFVGGGALRSSELYTTDIDERIERTEEWLYAGSRLRFTNQLGIGLGVERRKYRWGESVVSGSQIADELDRDSTTYKGEARLRHSALTDLVASAERLEDTFLVAPPSIATTVSYRYLAGFEFGDRAFMTGRLLAGVRDIPAETAGSAPAYRGPAVQAALSAPFSSVSASPQVTTVTSTTPPRARPRLSAIPTPTTGSRETWRSTVP